MEIRLYVICCFYLAAFNICSLCLIFVSLINMCFGVFHRGFILFETLWASWTWVVIFPILEMFWTIISSSIFSYSFLLSSTSGTPRIQMLGHLTLFQRSLRLSSLLFILFFFQLCFIYFHHSIFHLTYPFFCFSYSTVGSLQDVFNLSYCIVHYWWTILEETQAGIKIARRNISNLRYADDTTLMAESEEELKSLLMKVKVESEKVGLKLNILLTGVHSPRMDKEAGTDTIK